MSAEDNADALQWLEEGEGIPRDLDPFQPVLPGTLPLWARRVSPEVHTVPSSLGETAGVSQPLLSQLKFRPVDPRPGAVWLSRTEQEQHNTLHWGTKAVPRQVSTCLSRLREAGAAGDSGNTTLDGICCPPAPAPRPPAQIPQVASPAPAPGTAAPSAAPPLPNSSSSRTAPTGLPVAAAATAPHPLPPSGTKRHNPTAGSSAQCPSESLVDPLLPAMSCSSSGESSACSSLRSAHESPCKPPATEAISLEAHHTAAYPGREHLPLMAVAPPAVPSVAPGRSSQDQSNATPGSSAAWFAAAHDVQASGAPSSAGLQATDGHGLVVPALRAYGEEQLLQEQKQQEQERLQPPQQQQEKTSEKQQQQEEEEETSENQQQEQQQQQQDGAPVKKKLKIAPGELSLEDHTTLNPNHPNYDPDLAAQRRAERRQRQQARKMKKLSASDHKWFLSLTPEAAASLSKELLQRLGRVARSIEQQQLAHPNQVEAWLYADTGRYYQEHAGAKAMAERYVAAAKQHTCLSCPQFFRLHQTLSLAGLHPCPSDPVLRFLDVPQPYPRMPTFEKMEIGTLLGTPSPPSTLPEDSKTSPSPPGTRQASAAAVSGAAVPAPPPAISRDNLAHEFAGQKSCGVVMAAEAFEAMVCTMLKEWEIPVVVKECLEGGGGSHGSALSPVARRVFFDAPLLCRQWSSREQHSFVWSHVLRSGTSPSGKTMHPGTGAASEPQDGGGSTRSSSSGGSEDALCIDDGDEVMQAGGTAMEGRIDPSASSEAPPAACYKVFGFGDHRLLVCDRHAQAMPEEGGDRCVWVSGKADYLPGDGPREMLSDTERALLWAAAFLRTPTRCTGRQLKLSAHAVVGYVAAATGELLSLTRLNAASLLEERLPGSRFDPRYACRFVLEVIESAKQLEPGNYLMCHSPSVDAPRIQVFQAVDPARDHTDAVPLPVPSSLVVHPQQLFDLHAASTCMGATICPAEVAVQPCWWPADPAHPQVPFTETPVDVTQAPGAARRAAAPSQVEVAKQTNTTLQILA
eukprot:CAMPEP_0117688676 /NCGR_PEP_ID=MMETSP0804-20121206/23985_1 /TAXON_ID=1074897 /ORGANISM="Tetraselmis astigmatica, Strain CCMP880" /LENGTH=1025 /DNA_ID=CAMNT_0005501201 /DNA_START=233 /DNA_END=3306 /DNA_ORIENTATION=-